jgi:hypothetical protein
VLTKIDIAFPSDLPVPQDDGACSHLPGSNMPSVSLPATSGNVVDVASLSGLTILFCYPRTGAPGESIGDDWNSIPGARGCTPQACGFRDQLAELHDHGVKNVFGVSTQDTPYQAEAKARLHLTYDQETGDCDRGRKDHPCLVPGLPSRFEREGGGKVASAQKIVSSRYRSATLKQFAVLGYGFGRS